MSDTTSESKRCTKCGSSGPFGKQAKGRDGLRAVCKECHRLESRAYYSANKKRALEVAKRYRQNHLSEWKQYLQHYNEVNRQRNRNRCKQWAIKNPERVYELASQSRLTKRAKDYGVSGIFRAFEWDHILLTYGYRCVCCGTAIGHRSSHRDHVIPMSTGGSNDASNIQPLCPKCNRAKWRKDTDFRAWAYSVSVPH